jgi:hypothetical protein
MQKCRARLAINPPLVVALFGACFFTGDFAISDPRQPSAIETEVTASNCDPKNVVEYQADRVPDENIACASDAGIAAADRDYLIDTSTPGSTMMRQGTELAIGRLHPEFVRRLAAAIREARQAGMPSVGILSAYRPPAFGVGGFSDKFNSLHTYGLAADMSGIGRPGTAEAKLWHEIAARHGVACPYGAENRLEWNHCQPTRIRIVLPENPLRFTVTASGPIDLGSMFEAGDAMIESPESVAEAIAAAAAEPAAAAHAELTDKRLLTDKPQPTAKENEAKVAHIRLGKRDKFSRAARALARAEPARGCKKPAARKDACGSRPIATAAARGLRPRQTAASSSRHHT